MFFSTGKNVSSKCHGKLYSYTFIHIIYTGTTKTSMSQPRIRFGGLPKLHSASSKKMKLKIKGCFPKIRFISPVLLFRGPFSAIFTMFKRLGEVSTSTTSPGLSEADRWAPQADSRPKARGVSLPPSASGSRRDVQGQAARDGVASLPASF